MNEENASVSCAWCGRPTPKEARICPHCGREPQPEGITPLGGTNPAPLPRDRSLWGKPPPALGAREALERRRQEIAARNVSSQDLGYLEYLLRVLKQDQVFALLLALMTLNLIWSTLTAIQAKSLGSLLSPLFLLVMLFGLLTFQRLVHTILVWLAGAGLIMAGLSVVKLLLAPLAVASGWQLLGMWFNWILYFATLIFVLVVLCERNAYFEGVGKRPAPKRTRVRDFLNREYLRQALSRPAEYPEETSSPPGKADLRSAPSQFEGHPTMEASDHRVTMASLEEQTQPAQEPLTKQIDDLTPFGGGSKVKLTRGFDPEPREAHAASYRVERLPPAPGQTDGLDWQTTKRILSWAYIKQVARQDRIFGGLLVALALQGALTLLRPNFWAIAGAAVLIWGVLTLQRWGYYLALALAGLQIWFQLALFSAAYRLGQEVSVWVSSYLLAVIALNLFIFFALLAKRPLFE